MDVHLRLGPECNQRCVFCNVPHCKKLSTAEALGRIDYLSSASILSITGGEPTLRTDLCTLIAAASGKNIPHVSLQTNACMASYLTYAEKLKKAGLKNAFVSFHSHNENISNRLTVSKLWDKTLAGIRNLLKLKIAVSLNHVVNKLNYRQLPDYVKFVNNEFDGISALSVSFVQPHGRAWQNSWIVPRYSEVYPYLRRALNYCRRKGLHFNNPYCGFPLCFFPFLENVSMEYDDDMTDGKLEREAVGKVRRNKVKSAACKTCAYFLKCNGVWIAYGRLYGLAELKPVKKTTPRHLRSVDPLGQDS